MIYKASLPKSCWWDMVKAIIFDLDGVIIDSAELHKQSAAIVFRSIGLERASGDLSQLMGMRDQDIFHILKAKYRLSPLHENLVKKRIQIFLRLAASKLTLKKGVLQLLPRLRRRVKLAVTTSSAREIWQFADKKFNLSRFFDVVVTGDDSKKGKPDPEPYLKTCERLGVDPKDCIVIEDAVAGVRAAKQAGAKCIAIAQGSSRAAFWEADYVVGSLAEIDQGVLDRLMNN